MLLVIVHLFNITLKPNKIIRHQVEQNCNHISNSKHLHVWFGAKNSGERSGEATRGGKRMGRARGRLSTGETDL